MPLVLDHLPMPAVTLLMVAGSVCACCASFPSSSLPGSLGCPPGLREPARSGLDSGVL
jgi:hypothetical protein